MYQYYTVTAARHVLARRHELSDAVAHCEVPYDGIVGAVKLAREKEPRLAGVDLEAKRISQEQYNLATNVAKLAKAVCAALTSKANHGHKNTEGRASLASQVPRDEATA
jgi:hypothetical protein